MYKGQQQYRHPKSSLDLAAMDAGAPQAEFFSRIGIQIQDNQFETVFEEWYDFEQDTSRIEPSTEIEEDSSDDGVEYSSSSFAQMVESGDIKDEDCVPFSIFVLTKIATCKSSTIQQEFYQSFLRFIGGEVPRDLVDEQLAQLLPPSGADIVTLFLMKQNVITPDATRDIVAEYKPADTATLAKLIDNLSYLPDTHKDGIRLQIRSRELKKLFMYFGNLYAQVDRTGQADIAYSIDFLLNHCRISQKHFHAFIEKLNEGELIKLLTDIDNRAVIQLLPLPIVQKLFDHCFTVFDTQDLDMSNKAMQLMCLITDADVLAADEAREVAAHRRVPTKMRHYSKRVILLKQLEGMQSPNTIRLILDSLDINTLFTMLLRNPKNTENIVTILSLIIQNRYLDEVATLRTMAILEDHPFFQRKENFPDLCRIMTIIFKNYPNAIHAYQVRVLAAIHSGQALSPEVLIKLRGKLTAMAEVRMLKNDFMAAIIKGLFKYKKTEALYELKKFISTPGIFSKQLVHYYNALIAEQVSHCIQARRIAFVNRLVKLKIIEADTALTNGSVFECAAKMAHLKQSEVKAEHPGQEDRLLQLIAEDAFSLAEWHITHNREAISALSQDEELLTECINAILHKGEGTLLEALYDEVKVCRSPYLARFSDPELLEAFWPSLFQQGKDNFILLKLLLDPTRIGVKLEQSKIIALIRQAVQQRSPWCATYLLTCVKPRIDCYKALRINEKSDLIEILIAMDMELDIDDDELHLASIIKDLTPAALLASTLITKIEYAIEIECFDSLECLLSIMPDEHFQQTLADCLNFIAEHNKPDGVAALLTYIKQHIAPENKNSCYQALMQQIRTAVINRNPQLAQELLSCLQTLTRHCLEENKFQDFQAQIIQYFTGIVDEDSREREEPLAPNVDALQFIREYDLVNIDAQYTAPDQKEDETAVSRIIESSRAQHAHAQAAIYLMNLRADLCCVNTKSLREFLAYLPEISLSDLGCQPDQEEAMRAYAEARIYEALASREDQNTVQCNVQALHAYHRAAQNGHQGALDASIPYRYRDYYFTIWYIIAKKHADIGTEVRVDNPRASSEEAKEKLRLAEEREPDLYKQYISCFNCICDLVQWRQDMQTQAQAAFSPLKRFALQAARQYINVSSISAAWQDFQALIWKGHFWRKLGLGIKSVAISVAHIFICMCRPSARADNPKPNQLDAQPMRASLSFVSSGDSAVRVYAQLGVLGKGEEKKSEAAPGLQSPVITMCAAQFFEGAQPQRQSEKELSALCKPLSLEEQINNIQGATAETLLVHADKFDSIDKPIAAGLRALARTCQDCVAMSSSIQILLKQFIALQPALQTPECPETVKHTLSPIIQGSIEQLQTMHELATHFDRYLPALPQGY